MDLGILFLSRSRLQALTLPVGSTRATGRSGYCRAGIHLRPGSSENEEVLMRQP